MPTDEAQYKRVPVKDLEYDPANPRLGDEARRKSQPQIQKMLERAPHYALALVGSIVQNGFVPYEPLVVKKKGDIFQVIEGNRRLAAVKHIISDPQKYGRTHLHSLREIPVLIFHDADPATHEKDIQTYLGIKHMFGFRDWPAASKAIYLHKRISSKEDLRRVSLELDIKRNDIVRWLIPYRLRKAAQKIFRLVEPEDFWTLAESFGRSGIKPYIKLEYDNNTLKIMSFDKRKLKFLAEFLYGERVEEEEKLKSWAGKRRIGETRDLKDLAKVLSNETARETLEKGASLDDALVYAEPKEERILKLIRTFKNAFQKILSMRPNKRELSELKSFLAEFQRRIKKRI